MPSVHLPAARTAFEHVSRIQLEPTKLGCINYQSPYLCMYEPQLLTSSSHLQTLCCRLAAYRAWETRSQDTHPGMEWLLSLVQQLVPKDSHPQDHAAAVCHSLLVLWHGRNCLDCLTDSLPGWLKSPDCDRLCPLAENRA